jgi:hypothetical protein
MRYTTGELNIEIILQLFNLHPLCGHERGWRLINVFDNVQGAT